MRVTVGVLTFCRPWLLERTLATLEKTMELFNLVVMDNADGKDGATEKIVKAHEPTAYVYRPQLVVGKAQNELAEICLSYGPDLVLMTADDYEYEKGWLEKLIAWWEGAPDDLAITTCSLEPEYPWNAVSDVAEYGGVRGLIRECVPGANWSFRSEMADKIFPLSEKTGGEDLEACRKLRPEYRLAALDLAIHTGERQSAWGNESWKRGKPLDREKWGL